jgi:hypothetical protein
MMNDNPHGACRVRANGMGCAIILPVQDTLRHY